MASEGEDGQNIPNSDGEKEPSVNSEISLNQKAPEPATVENTESETRHGQGHVPIGKEKHDTLKVLQEFPQNIHTNEMKLGYRGKTIKQQNITGSQRRISSLPPRKPIEIRFSDLSYEVRKNSIFAFKKKYKCILHSLTGTFSSHQLTGILGPSGAGKSSLMNILAGYKQNGMSGKIKVNGHPRNSSLFRKLSCYIQQDDRLLQQFTVTESMRVSAQLNLPKNTTRQLKQDIIDEILNSLDLVACGPTRIANLSGGQRKRLAIAIELINNPPVMFFDEPTSGLDSLTSFQVIKLLKSFANQGKNVICTIHQPSAKLFELFDKIYIMANGNCIYEGRVDGLLPFLAQHGLQCPQYHNPADYAIEVASGEYGDVVDLLAQAVKDGLCNFPVPEDRGYMTKEGGSFSTAVHYSDADFAHCKVFTNNFYRQFIILLKRTFIGILRDKLLTHIRFVSQIAIAVLLGLLFLDIGNEATKVLENAALLFFTIMYGIFAAMMPTVLTFPVETAVFLREHMNCWYSIKAYYIAKTLADIPLQIFFPVVFCVIVYFMTSQPYDATRFTLFTVWTVVTSIVAQSFGLLLGAASPTVEVATFLGPITTIPVLLFCGFFVRFNTIPFYLKWLGYIAYVRYGFEGVIVSIYGYNRTDLECNSAAGIGCQFQNTTLILQEMDVEEDNLPFDGIIMAIFFVGFRLIGYVMIKLRVALER